MTEYSILGTTADGAEMAWLAGPFEDLRGAMTLYPVLLRAFDRCGLKGFCILKCEHPSDQGVL